MSETPEKAEEAEENYFLLNAFNFKAEESEAGAGTDELPKDEHWEFNIKEAAETNCGIRVTHSRQFFGRPTQQENAQRMLGIILRAGIRERKRITGKLLIN